MKENRTWLANFIGTLLLLGLFAISALILIAAGIRVYNNVVSANQDNFELRTSLSYVATKLRSNDVAGGIELAEIEGRQVLILNEDIGGARYQTLIYHDDGYICELFQKAGFEQELSSGFQTVEVSGFSFSAGEDGGITLVAENEAGDRETLTFYPRSET